MSTKESLIDGGRALSYGRAGARLGDIAVELGFCTREAVELAVASALESRRQLGQVLW